VLAEIIVHEKSRRRSLAKKAATIATAVIVTFALTLPKPDAVERMAD
jgi:hypothetical protein